VIVNLLAILISLASSLYLFRGLWSGVFIGEIFDTRLMIVLHEHWFRFFTGKTSFLDAGFYYPYPRSFALTDTFLLTGITHSFVRLTGIDIIESWVISQFIWVTIGLIGWYVLAKKIIVNRFLQIITMPLIATSFPFVAHLNERPNVVPYLLVSWIFVFIFNFYSINNANKYSINFGMLFVSIPLLVLTSWYAGFFLVIFLIIFLIISIMLRAPYLKIVTSKVKGLNFKIFFPFSILSLFLTILWATIYLPELGYSAKVARPVSEVIDGSPSLSEIFNTNALNGSSFFTLFDSPYEVMEESKIGISFLPFITLIILIILNAILRFKVLSKNNFLFISLLLISGLFIEFIIVKFYTSASVFIFLFNQFSFLKSIRTPVRWHIYFMFLILIIVIYLIDKFLFQKNTFITFLILLIPIFLLIEQQRSSPGLWVKSEYLDENLLPYENKLKKCSAFVLDRPDTGYWSDMIQALALSVYVNRPTANGYSGSLPKNYPFIDWYADGNLPAIGSWLLANDSLAGTCMLDGINYTNLSRFDSNSVNFAPGQGFTGLEKTKNSLWSWSVWEESTFYLQSFKDSNTTGNLEFTIEIPNCLDGAKFNIKGQEIDFKFELENTNTALVKIPIQIGRWERIPMIIQKNPGFCNLEGDPRDLHFSLKDVKVIATS
jgi:hypothetical protein